MPEPPTRWATVRETRTSLGVRLDALGDVDGDAADVVGV
jgi:hypothetical protein